MEHIWNMNRPTMVMMTDPVYVMECVYFSSIKHGKKTEESVVLAVKWACEAGVPKHKAEEWADTLPNNYDVVHRVYG